MTVKRSKFTFPHAFVLLFGIIVFVAILTYIIPAGEFSRVEVAGRTVVDPESYHAVPQAPTKPFDVFTAIPKGLNAASGLIFMILIIGASIQLFDDTGAIKSAIFRLLRIIGETRRSWVLATIMIFFGCLGAFPGMLEAAIPFAPLCVGIALSLGYDPLVGIAIPLVSIVSGWTAGPSNPWTVGIGQSLAELPLFSGFGYRVLILVALLSAAIVYVVRYGEKVRKDPSASIVSDLDFSHLKNREETSETFSFRHGVIMTIFAVTIGTIIYGTFQWRWGMIQMSGAYIVGAVAAGIVAGYSSGKIADTLLEGGKSIFIGVVAVGLARAISVVMTDGRITDTIVCAISQSLKGLPPVFTSIAMFVVQTILNFFIPSGSGQALVTLPIMLPVADIIELKRQVAILAFQFGDGLSNLCYPTVGVLVAFLIYTKVPFDRWIRFIAPFMVIAWCLSIGFLSLAVISGFGPF